MCLQDTLLHCLSNKLKKERTPLVHSSTVQEMKKFGVKRNTQDFSQSLLAMSLKRRYILVIMHTLKTFNCKAKVKVHIAA